MMIVDWMFIEYVELKELAKRKGLALSANQRSKTAIALGAINAGR
jgi:ABC-type sulfate/molybdate transport systems ATPase subunit